MSAGQPRVRRTFYRSDGSNGVTFEGRPSLRSFALEILRKTIAVAALVGGIIAVVKIPALLLPLLPVEALIAFELIVRGDMANQREGQEIRRRL